MIPSILDRLTDQLAEDEEHKARSSLLARQLLDKIKAPIPRADKARAVGQIVNELARHVGVDV